MSPVRLGARQGHIGLRGGSGVLLPEQQGNELPRVGHSGRRTGISRQGSVGEEVVAGDTCRARRPDVTFLIPEAEALRQVNVQFLRRPQEHARFGFAQGTAQIRAVIDRIQPATFCRKKVLHVACQALVIFLAEVAAGDAALVCADNQAVSGLFRGTRQLENAGDEFKLFGFVEVIDLDIDGAIAVEEQGGTHLHHTAGGGGAGDDTAEDDSAGDDAARDDAAGGAMTDTSVRTPLRHCRMKALTSSQVTARSSPGTCSV